MARYCLANLATLVYSDGAQQRKSVAIVERSKGHIKELRIDDAFNYDLRQPKVKELLARLQWDALRTLCIYEDYLFGCGATFEILCNTSTYLALRALQKLDIQAYHRGTSWTISTLTRNYARVNASVTPRTRASPFSP